MGSVELGEAVELIRIVIPAGTAKPDQDVHAARLREISRLGIMKTQKYIAPSTRAMATPTEIQRSMIPPFVLPGSRRGVLDASLHAPFAELIEIMMRTPI
jgi:hypothetical protein